MKAEFDREHEVGPAGPARALAQPRLATAQRRTAPHSAAQRRTGETGRDEKATRDERDAEEGGPSSSSDEENPRASSSRAPGQTRI